MARVISALFYLVFGIFTLVYFTLFSVVFVLTVPFDRNRVVLHWVSRVWTICYLGIVPTWSVSCEGKENIKKGESYVVIVNHSSFMDILLMYVVPLNFKWVAKREVYKWPIFGWVLSMHGDITIERGTAGGLRKLIREAKKWFGRGVSVMIFPEGSRSRDGKIHKFHEGAFLMAKEAGVPILPCASIGTGTATTGGMINFRNKFRVRILPVVDAQTVAKTPAKELAAQMQALITGEYEKMLIEQNERSS